MKIPSKLAFMLAALAACETAPNTTAPADAPARDESSLRAEAARFLEAYNAKYRELYTADQEAQWLANTHIVDGDRTNEERTQAADEALAAFTGSVANIDSARKFLARRAELSPIQALEFDKVLFNAGGNPATAAALVKERITAENAQVAKLYGFKFTLDQQEITPNAIDEGLRSEKDLAQRRKIWESSKAVGQALRPGLIDLQRLRNACVRALGYHDFFAYKASEYGMTTDELARSVGDINRQLRPLFKELHTWARYELAKRYGQSVPDLIPADWLPNRWGQDWQALVDVPGFDLDQPLKAKGPEWVIHQAERFYVSLGFANLPQSFWQKSSLFPVAPDAGFKKNTHATAWHIDLDRDVRSLMSVEPNTEWYETTHHELGHIYYYLSYSNPNVPYVLREGANRAYHEAIGSLMGLAAQQPRFVQAVGLELQGAKPDPMQLLLHEALMYAVFIPWSTGTMFEWECELYAEELPASKWNQRWWELAAKYQGIAPPTPRGEEFCDAATKTHVTDDPAAYYDYALSFVLLFQLHDHIAKQILHEDPHDTNYFGRTEVGDWLRSILSPGASVDWRKLLKDKTGSELTAQPMLEYFAPLMDWLKQQNQGRKATLQDL